MYAFIATRMLQLPGIYYDEVLQAVPALAAVRGGLDSSFTEVGRSVVTVAGHPFPLLILPYLGSFQVLVLAPVFALFGPSVYTMRVAFVALGITPIILTYIFTQRLFGRSAAVLTGLLLALDSTYIFATRSDNGPTTAMLTLKMGAFCALLAWWQTGRRRTLALGALLLGLGMYDKLNFAWVIASLGASTLLLAPRAVVRRLRQEGPVTALAALGPFLAGSSIPLAYLALTRGSALESAASMAGGSTAFGVSNANLIGNLQIRVQTIADLLSGYRILDFYTSTFTGEQFPYSHFPFASTLVPWLVIAATLLCLLQWRLHWSAGLSQRKTLFLLLNGAFVVLASVFTPTNLMYHHELVAYPVFHIVAGHLLSQAPAVLQSWHPPGRPGAAPRGLIQVAAMSLVGISMAASAGVTWNSYRIIGETGGVGMWSDGIYRLADSLREDRRTIVAMDWGISLDLLFLSGGRSHVMEGWRDVLYEDGPTDTMAEIIRPSGRVFVFHAPRYSGILTLTDVDRPRITFFQTIESMGLTPILEREIYQRDGSTLFEVYSVGGPVTQ